MASQKKKNNFEMNFLNEDIKKEISKCTLCGLCLTSCPRFNALHLQEHTPRSIIAILLKSLKKDEIMNFDELIFSCTLCKSCEFVCPVKVKITDIVLELRKQIPKKEILKNIKKYKNPIGESNEWYCC